MKVLIVGGSGFVSGTLARKALDQGCDVWVVTRGKRAVPDGARALVADRHNAVEFQGAVMGAAANWDLVVDCIGYDPADARQDLTTFAGRTPHLVFISTDFVYDPLHRKFPQPVESDHYLPDGYGGKKRQCELELQVSAPADLHWTVLRPCHIYGPGSELGCLPLHGRDPELLGRLRRGETLRLVAAGTYLQQPLFVRDLAETVLSCAGNEAASGRIFCVAGPDIIESREYYRLIAEVLDVDLRIEWVDETQHLAENPGHISFCCHRIYDLTGLAEAGLHVPLTPVAEGLREHVEWKLGEG